MKHLNDFLLIQVSMLFVTVGCGFFVRPQAPLSSCFKNERGIAFNAVPVPFIQYIHAPQCETLFFFPAGEVNVSVQPSLGS